VELLIETLTDGEMEATVNGYWALHQSISCASIVVPIESRKKSDFAKSRFFCAFFYALSYIQWSGQKSGSDRAVSSEFVIAGMIVHPSRVQSSLLQT
jgi:hypothetical protein